MIARAALAACALLAACDLDSTIGLTIDPGSIHSIDRPLRFSGRDRIDLLLMVDDSGSMAPKQALLRNELPAMVTELSSANAQRNVRVGVITSDLGAPGIACGKDRGGKLQPIGAAAPAGCQPPTGTPWLSVAQSGSNTPDGQSVASTIECMTNVGDTGCGFEMPLEAVRRQLTGMADTGEPFLRDDSLLVVVFVTDEDDCSADAASDLFTPNPAYGPLNSFRCARYGVLCGGGLISDNPATYGVCRPAQPTDGGKLTDVQTYIDLFTRSRADGGLKDEPSDVVVAALDAAPSPFITTTGFGTDLCGQGATSCTVEVHSCMSAADSSLFGDPAVRLDSVVQASGGLSRSICDTSYSAFTTALTARIEAAAGGNACLPGPIADPSAPNCTVMVDGAPVPHCIGTPASERCWVVDNDPACPQQIDPRDGSSQVLHMRVIAAPLDQVSATCSILVGN